MVFFWWISSTIFIGALIVEFIIVFFGTLPYRYVVINIKKIREKYRNKYGKLAGQYFWFYYESYTIPLLSSSLYFPLLLITYEIPSFQIINLPSHIITTSLFPIYIALPIGLIIIILGFLIRIPSGGFGPTVEIYLPLLYPEKGRLITNGIYKYVRHPRYLGRGFVAVGLGVIANNIMAILVGFIHFLVFCSLIRPEDNELSKRFGNDYINYKRNVPALIPKYGNWKKFLRLVFVQKKSR
jgi:protein-S-isoprenylcysteine O-methyltransferase Ste14